MPRRKAQYNGEPSFTEKIAAGIPPSVRDFTESLKVKLKAFYPDKCAVDDPVWGHPADTFVNALLAEARWALSRMDDVPKALAKDDIRAERDDLLRTLKNVQDGLRILPSAQHNLRRLSPDFDRLLGVDADPLGCADALGTLIERSKPAESALDILIGKIESAESSIESLGRKQRPDEMQHRIAVEMAIRVLRVAKNYGLLIYATGSDGLDYTSDAVQLLKSIGDDMGLVLAELTWRDIIIEAKKQAPDLQ